MRKKVVSIVVASVVTILFLLDVFSSGSHVFNLIPYLIHESLSRGGGGENTFVTVFDLISAVLLFFIVRWVMQQLMNNKN